MSVLQVSGPAQHDYKRIVTRPASDCGVYRQLNLANTEIIRKELRDLILLANEYEK